MKCLLIQTSKDVINLCLQIEMGGSAKKSGTFKIGFGYRYKPYEHTKSYWKGKDKEKVNCKTEEICL